MRKIFSAALALVCIWFASPALAALPSGYTQLEYIESTGKQYIDTGIEVNASKLTSGMRMELDIQFLSTNRQNGGNGVTTGPYFWIGYYHPGKLYCGLGNLYPAITVSQNIFSRHSYVLDSALKNFYIDDVLVESYDISAYNGTGKTNITLFSIGTTSFYVKQKLYKASIYQANNLVGNFIPAKRNSDGAIGLYDTVSGEFFENKGEGTFVAGPVVEIKIATTKYNESAFGPLNTALQNAISVVDSVVSNTITQAGRIATLQTQKQTRPNDIADDNEKCPAGKKCLLVEDASGVPHWYEIVENAYGLPSGYTALEYIQSDGASYLIVPYRVNNKTVFYCRYNEIQNGPQTANAVFGVTTSPDVSKANNGILRLTGSNFNRMGWGDSVSGSVIDVTAPKAFNTWYEVLYEQNKLYQNDRLYATSATQTNVSWVAENDLGIFARNSESVTMPAIAKISSVWAKENGEYKINLIPARRNSDNVIGMYDTVSGEFFTNKGSGSFIAGDPVVE